MPINRLLLTMLPGLLPLLVFVVVSEIYGDIVGLWIGVGLGVLEFLFILLKQKRIDAFVALDVGLLVATGLISIVLSDDLFFKLKPVFLETLVLVLIGVSAFGPKNLLMGMAFRGQAGEAIRQKIEANEQAGLRMRKLLKGFTFLVFAHTLLSLASALWMSKEAWAFITGVLLYILFGIWLLMQFLLTALRNILARKQTENQIVKK